VAAPLDDITISGNTLDSAARSNSIAIHFADAGGTQPISGVLVEKNLIQDNTLGVVIGPGANQDNAISATINNNSFTGNTTALFRSALAAGSTTIDATLNWWGHISGPTTLANPGGHGQAINDTTGITFRPWLVYAPDSNTALPGVQALPGTGTVTATFAGGVLTLTGDDASNIIQLAQVGTDITITGTGTTIGGGPTFTGVTSIKTAMKGGDDVVTINQLTPFSLTGASTFDLGDGSNTLSLITAGLLSLGGLTVKAGDGGDVVAVSGAAASAVTGNASLNLGAGSTDVTLNAMQVQGAGGFKVNATDGDDTLRLTGAEVTKAITASTGNGSLLVDSTGGTYGSVSLTAGGKVPSDPSQGVALDLDTPTVTGAVKLNSKAGARFDTNGGSVGSVSVTAGKLGTAEVNLTGSPTVNGAFTVKGQEAVFNVLPGGTPTIDGNLKVTGTTHTLTRMFPTSVVNIGGSVSTQGGAGTMSFIAEGTSLTVGKTLTVKAQSNTSIQIVPTAASQITGNVSLTSGVEDDDMIINSTVGLGGDLTIKAGAGNNAITLGSTTANLAVGRNLSVTTAGGDDVITLNRTAVAGTTTAKTGAGSDLLDMTGPATFTGATTIDLGAGDDEWRAASSVGTTTGPVTFTGKVNAKLGAGNDTLILGLAVAAGGNTNTVVAFVAPSGNKIDGGTGLNLFDDELGQFTPPTLAVVGFTDPTL
jgi:hypothetical protein